MQPLEPAAAVPLTAAQRAALVQTIRSKMKISVKEAEAFIEDARKGQLWKNEVYTVVQREYADGIVHLSIRRNDRGACRDWRDFQAIKNQLLGPEAEAVELYPAESRVVDAANQYHLWSRKGCRFELGFAEGLQMDDQQFEWSKAIGAVQRPLGS